MIIFRLCEFAEYSKLSAEEIPSLDGNIYERYPRFSFRKL